MGAVYKGGGGSLLQIGRLLGHHPWCLSVFVCVSSMFVYSMSPCSCNLSHICFARLCILVFMGSMLCLLCSASVVIVSGYVVSSAHLSALF